MDNDNPLMANMPSSSNGFKPAGNNNQIMFILIGVLGIGTLIFGILAIVFFAKANTATSTLEEQKSIAVAEAKITQKKADDQAAMVAAASPFRSYVSPIEYGSFTIKFPKNWSSYQVHERSGNQVSLALNPDFVRRTNGSDELMATRVLLREEPKDRFLKSFENYVKRGSLKQNHIVVSGLDGFDLTGQFADKRTTRLVVIPVRDKVLLFYNENNRFASEFNEILAQAKINP